MTTHKFCLFVEGADLTVAVTVERLESVGYSHVAAAGHNGVQPLVFSCEAEQLAEAVSAVVAAAERVPGLCVAREARGGEVPVFDPYSLELTSTCAVATSPEADRTAPRREHRRSQHKRPAGGRS